jgi:hypothetical protein
VGVTRRAGRGGSGRRRGIAWKALLDWAAALPGVEQGLCFGTPALYVRKRILACLREDGRTLAIKIDFLDRDVLLEADPKAFFLTDHYRPYPMVVMRLDEVRPEVARSLLEDAWERAAPERLMSAREGGKPPGKAPAGRRAARRRPKQPPARP